MFLLISVFERELCQMRRGTHEECFKTMVDDVVEFSKDTQDWTDEQAEEYKAAITMDSLDTPNSLYDEIPGFGSDWEVSADSAWSNIGMGSSNCDWYIISLDD